MEVVRELKQAWKELTAGPQPEEKKPTPKAAYVSYSNQGVFSFTGEKNLGDIGPVKDYYLDYEILRLRSWQAYLENESAQTVLNKYILWVVGSGLKMNANVLKTVLKSEKINLPKTTFEEFNEVVEARWEAWSKSKKSDYRGMAGLGAVANKAYKTALMGDCLVVLRVKNGNVSVELIDGHRVCNPPGDYGTDYFAQAKGNGNYIRHGIEMKPSGEHVAYYVRGINGLDQFVYERIDAKGKQTGLTMAYLVYGMEFRLDNNRGIPIISTNLNTLAKLDRYKEATVATAEEVAKISYTIEHNINGTGENPMIDQLARAVNVDGPDRNLAEDIAGNQLADKFAATTQKQIYNLPQGASIKTLKNDGQLHFKDFFEVNIENLCAAIGIPPNVALSKYNDSYSASRAAIKDWEHVLSVARKRFSDEFYTPIYILWLHNEIIRNKVNAQGYIDAYLNQNDTILCAWRNARFTGTPVPHIDPVKEVKAEREKLGPMGANIPLTTVEDACERLGTGESDSIAAQFAEEMKQADTLGIKPKEIQSSGGE